MVLAALQRLGSVSVTELMERTGLSELQVRSAVAGLARRGLVNEAQHVSIDPRAGVVVAIDVGGSHMAGAVVDLAARILARVDVVGPPGPGGQAVVDLASRLVERVGLAGCRLLGVGVSCAGVVDDQGLVVAASNLQWHRLPLGDMLRERLGTAVVVENDTNAAALGEYYFGAGPGRGDILYIGVGTGVGAGIVVRGEILRGSRNAAGEIGHTRVVENGSLCACGRRGCLETVASGRGIVERTVEFLAAGEPSVLRELLVTSRRPLSAQDVAVAAATGDALAQRMLASAAGWLGTTAGNLGNVLNPARIVIGGGVSLSGPGFLAAVERTAREVLLEVQNASVTFAAAELGSDSGILGATALVMDAVLRD